MNDETILENDNAEDETVTTNSLNEEEKEELQKAKLREKAEQERLIREQQEREDVLSNHIAINGITNSNDKNYGSIINSQNNSFSNFSINASEEEKTIFIAPNEELKTNGNMYDEITSLFTNLQQAYYGNNVINPEKPDLLQSYDFRYHGIKIGEISQDGTIKLNSTIVSQELGLDVQQIKNAIHKSEFLKDNQVIKENCILPTDKNEHKWVTKFEKESQSYKDKKEVNEIIEARTFEGIEEIFEEEENQEIFEDISVVDYDDTIIDNEDLGLTDEELAEIQEEQERKDKSISALFDNIKTCEEEKLSQLIDNTKENSISNNDIASYKDENGNNILHLAAQNPNLTENSLFLINNHLGNENLKTLYFEKNNEGQIPLEISRVTNFENLENVNLSKTYNDKKQTLDVPKPFALMSMATSAYFDKNKNSFSKEQFNQTKSDIDSVMKNSLKNQMSQRKSIIENWDFKNDEMGIRQNFEKNGSPIFNKAINGNIISYNFMQHDNNGKEIIDNIKLAETKNGLSIYESSSQNLTALVEKNFKIPKDNQYKITKDISQSNLFTTPFDKNQPTQNLKEFPNDFMKQHNYFPPMYVEQNGIVNMQGKDEFGNNCIYKMTQNQMTNIIDNSITYGIKNGEKIDMSKNENFVPKKHIDFIKNNFPDADVSLSYRNSLDAFKDAHSKNILAPYKNEQSIIRKEQLEKEIKKHSYEQIKNRNGIER